jgi:hypothetical protein
VTPQSGRSWIKVLPESEKNALLLKAASGDISAELARRIQRAAKAEKPREARTAGMLRTEAGM